jgi:hypothetical protein
LDQSAEDEGEHGPGLQLMDTREFVAIGGRRRGADAGGTSRGRRRWGANESKTHASRQKGMPASTPRAAMKKGRPEAAFQEDRESSLARAPDQKK